MVSIRPQDRALYSFGSIHKRVIATPDFERMWANQEQNHVAQSLGSLKTEGPDMSPTYFRPRSRSRSYSFTVENV